MNVEGTELNHTLNMAFSSSFEHMQMRNFPDVNTTYPYLNWKTMLFCWTAYEV
jgi:hypothetical protein